MRQTRSSPPSQARAMSSDDPRYSDGSLLGARPVLAMALSNLRGEGRRYTEQTVQATMLLAWLDHIGIPAAPAFLENDKDAVLYRLGIVHDRTRTLDGDDERVDAAAHSVIAHMLAELADALGVDGFNGVTDIEQLGHAMALVREATQRHPQGAQRSTPTENPPTPRRAWTEPNAGKRKASPTVPQDQKSVAWHPPSKQPAPGSVVTVEMPDGGPLLTGTA